MSQVFEQTPLWRRTLAPQPADPYADPRETLRAAYFQFRATVAPLAAEIALSMPIFTDHSIVHIDALWDTASLVCGDDIPLNPAEAFVLGGAFLMHDLGMGLAAYPLGQAELTSDPEFADLLAGNEARLRDTDTSVTPEELSRAAHDQSVIDLLRLRHAGQAERLIASPFRTSNGEDLYLLQDGAMRHHFGSLIGRIAASHWWDVDDLRCLEQRQGSYADHPPGWDIDPLKIACILRLADAAQVDHRRAPTYLHAFRKVTGLSGDHWHFQERLTRPRVVGDRLEYTATRPFGRDEAEAWWLAYDTILIIDRELRQVDALCADLNRPRFTVRSVAGADSPERLAVYIRTDRWRPVDASLRVKDVKRVIATLGGHDLYGNRPDVALRELVANAADAVGARSAYESGPPGTVTVRLSRENDDWWLTVEDQGIGMDPRTMVRALTDFGYSRWRSEEALRQYPGIMAKGFQPTGRFGIGFFAVFMVADEVQVRSLAYEDGPRSTHVLEFRHGLAGRPLLREADPPERLRWHGTTVRVKLRDDPRTADGLFRTDQRRLSHTKLLHALLTRMCALIDVNIEGKGPDDVAPIRLVSACDWPEISPAELFRRIYPREEADYQNRLYYDSYEKIFVERARELRDESGQVIGRAMIASGWEPLESDVQLWELPEAPVYVGGLQAGEIEYCMGAFVGMPLTADRLKAFPVASPEILREWVESQAEIARHSPKAVVSNLIFTAMLARGLGAQALNLPCAVTAHGYVDQAALGDWLTGRDEVLLVNPRFYIFHIDPRLPRFFTFSGEEVGMRENCLVASLYSLWLFPDEVLPRPRDERFADTVAPESGSWHAQSWWYDTGNFGSISLVMHRIAEVWGLDIPKLLDLMEPLHFEDDGDRRPELAKAGGGSLRVNMIRLRRPEGSRDDD